MYKLLFMLVISTCLIFPQSKKVKITGEYEYTYGDNESLIEAKEICYTMALRNAIETYQVFITSTATVSDYKMIKDLVRTISFGHVQDVNITEEKISGRKIYYKIEGYINPIEIKNVLNTEIKKSKNKTDFEPILENEYIKILSVKNKKCKPKYNSKDKTFNCLVIMYQQKKFGGKWDIVNIYNPSRDSVVGLTRIHIDWFDENGEPIETSVHVTDPRLTEGDFGKIELDEYEIKGHTFNIRLK